VQGTAFRVQGAEYRVQSSGCRVQGNQNNSLRISGSDFGFQVSDFGFRISGFGVRVSNSGFRTRGMGFRGVEPRPKRPPHWWEGSRLSCEGTRRFRGQPATAAQIVPAPFHHLERELLSYVRERERELLHSLKH